jgi:uncharacterized protein Yka (UPF0111/DUF47 family)
MGFRLIPGEDKFFQLFTDAGANLTQAGEVVAGLRDPGADRAATATAMRECEHRGDTITHEVFRLLNKSFVTPFDREDIYRLASSLDDVVDILDEVTDFLDLAKVGPLPRLMDEQFKVVCRGCAVTGEAIGDLRSLARLEPYWIEVNRLENEADQLYRPLLIDLFSGAYETLQMVKLREVADLLENAADALESVAHVVETIAVKES